MRHYSFQKGLLGSLVSLDSISKSRDAALLVDAPRESFLRCGAERVLLLFWSATRSVTEYIEVDALGEKLARWKITDVPFIGTRAHGLALTEDGRIFVSFSGHTESDNKLRHGLYELRAKDGVSLVTLIPLEQTVTAYDRGGGNCHDALPVGTFLALWGADGNELVVQRVGDDWGLSWASVSASSSNLN